MSNPRTLAKGTLERLEHESQPANPSYWLRPDELLDETASQRSRFFHHQGFLHVSSFCSTTECEHMKKEMARLVDQDWNPNDQIDSFGTTELENVSRGDYFLESADNVHYFAEPECMIDGKLKPEFQDKKLEAVNKAGHALHLQPQSPFHSYCTSSKIRHLVVNELGWKDPVVPQSMYIFKQAKLGGAVNSHQDSTFLYTSPQQSCLGLWLALDEATLENGCLWVRPQSHREAVRRRYKRNHAYFGQGQIDARNNEPKGDVKGQPMFVMEDVYAHKVAWDGDLPKGKDARAALLDAGFIPVECRPGDLVAFCGELDHLSLPNTSASARHTFQLHLVEGPNAGIEWATSNWLQYPDGKSFMRLST